MKYEVERKFRLADPQAFQDSARSLGIQFGAAVEQIDEYFAHPNRDFGSTDEALRLRIIEDQCRITYKGPKIDSETKTRLEIELPFAADVAIEEAAALLENLGFRRVAQVRKLRRTAAHPVDQWTFAIDLDEVDGLGSFLELDVAANESDVPAAQAAMQTLQRQLGLDADIRESYLEMLLG